MNKFKGTFSIFLVAFIASSMMLFSCNKDSENQPNSSDTKWSVDSYNFTANNNGGILIASDTGALFGASDKEKNSILILFKNTPNLGVYNVVNSTKKTNTSMYNSDDCSMMITNKTSSDGVYISILDTAGVVNVSKSGSKLTATFTNVKLGVIDKASAAIKPVYATGVIVEK
ncbi:MAG: hypothetical protein M9958_04120 [Chitinophagales bacterium]|nr:hypothetical protein [Chitinophagales bacterium]